MTPIEQAASVYEREPCRRTLKEDLELHLLNGYVFSTPTCFVMGRPVVREADPADIVDPAITFDGRYLDCWHVYLAAGDMREAIRFMPYPLEYMSFERKNVLHIWKRARISALLIRCCKVNSIC